VKKRQKVCRGDQQATGKKQHQPKGEQKTIKHRERGVENTWNRLGFGNTQAGRQQARTKKAAREGFGNANRKTWNPETTPHTPVTTQMRRKESTIKKHRYVHMMVGVVYFVGVP
jgi:hypothetical protein